MTIEEDEGSPHLETSIIFLNRLDVDSSARHNGRKE
jgi:hypothetical protein